MEKQLLHSNVSSKDCSKSVSAESKIACFTKALKKDSENASLYFKRGKVYQEIFKFTSAMYDFLKVVELEPGNGDAYYALASVASLAYYKEKAVFWLKKAFETGYNDYEQLVNDPSFQNLKNNREFKKILKISYQRSRQKTDKESF